MNPFFILLGLALLSILLVLALSFMGWTDDLLDRLFGHKK